MQVTIATGKTKTRQSVAPVTLPKKRAKRTTKKQQQDAANWQAYIAARRQHDADPEAGTSLSWRQYNRLLFLKWQVTEGKLTEFPGQTQAEGESNLFNYAWSDESVTGTPLKSQYL